MSDNSAVLLKRAKSRCSAKNAKIILARETNLSRISEKSKSSVKTLDRNKVSGITDTNNHYKSRRDKETECTNNPSRHIRIRQMEDNLFRLKELSGKIITHDKLCETELAPEVDWYKPKLPAIPRQTCPPVEKPEITKSKKLPKIKTFDTTKQQKEIEILKKRLNVH